MIFFCLLPTGSLVLLQLVDIRRRDGVGGGGGGGGGRGGGGEKCSGGGGKSQELTNICPNKMRPACAFHETLQLNHPCL